MTSLSLEIDGCHIPAEAGEMLIAATDRAAIYIPRFCYHPALSIAANCRMCLVEVEGAPKPLPACATPVVAGMKVFTRSAQAREAQRGTLEFLLINHPLDCPVCDQGGECPLQDQAMEYGSDDSRFGERKRAVASHDIGPLVATEMTRCIHCTRCVRFGEEIAGVMEMGMPGRGEHAHIGTFLNRSVDSEVSGNMIDLCPVGALTSKPYRFAARTWELRDHRGISPHDCVGANLKIQTLRGQVERVLPRERPEVNQCWLADRERYSYQAVNSAQRLSAPMLKDREHWRPAAWEEALRYACDGIGRIVEHSGGEQFAALAGPAATLQEYYLLAKLTRALGSHHVDHRATQQDFRDDRWAASFPASELPIDHFGNLKAALLLGANIRKEQPLLALRLRAAVHAAGGVYARGDQPAARISSVNPLAYPQNFTQQNALAVGADLPAALAAVAAAIARLAEVDLPDDIAQWVEVENPANSAANSAQKAAPTGNPAANLVADSLANSADKSAKNIAAPAENAVDKSTQNSAGNDEISTTADHAIATAAIAQDLWTARADGVLILGAIAQQHAEASVIKTMARWICRITDSRLAILPPGNGAAAWLAGCVPHRAAGGRAAQLPAAQCGLDAAAMFAQPRRAYLLLGSDPALDSTDGQRASEALAGADFVVCITAYKDDDAARYADVLLPMAAFTETAGDFVNCEGRLQHAEAAAVPLGEARPAWKILRVLANFLDRPGFEQVSLAQVSAEIERAGVRPARLQSQVTQSQAFHSEAGDADGAHAGAAALDAKIPPPRPASTVGHATRLLDMPMYRGDQTVRHAAALQRTADCPPPAAHMSRATIDRLGLRAGAPVVVRQTAIPDRHVRLPLRVDERVPQGSVYVPAGFARTAPLGGGGRVTVTAAQTSEPEDGDAPLADITVAKNAATKRHPQRPVAAKTT